MGQCGHLCLPTSGDPGSGERGKWTNLSTILQRKLLEPNIEMQELHLARMSTTIIFTLNFSQFVSWSMTYQITEGLHSQVEQILNMEVVDAMMVEQVLQELVVATTTEETSLFPQDLGTTTNILDMTVGFLMQDLSSSNPFPLSTVSKGECQEGEEGVGWSIGEEV